MKFNWGGLLRVAAPKVLGLGAGALSGWIYTKTAGSVNVDPDKLVGLVVTMAGSATAVGKIFEAHVNPVSAASPVVAQAGVDVKKEAIDLTKSEEGTK